MDTGERALLEQTVLDAITATSGAADEVDQALAGLGWLEMLREEPDDAVAIVFRALGTTNATASVLDDVLVNALGLEPDDRLAMLLPRFGGWTPPEGDGIASARITSARELLVVGADGATRLPAPNLERIELHGIDPAAGLHGVRVDSSTAGIEPLGPDAWDYAIAAGRVAIAHQITGACRAMLELARTHALDREQFGHPIARFQAVRHRLADALVAIEAAEAALTAAIDAPGSMTAALAKAVAGRSARTVARHCQQVLAGIGFTTDHPFHRFMKRTMVLDGLLGSTDEIVFDIGRTLLATRQVPTLVEL